MKKLLIYLSFILLITCAKDSTEDNSSVYVAPPTNTTNPTSTPTVTQYTLTVSATEGGTVSTEGGTYDEGTEVTITATANEGYRFTGWGGNSSTNESLTITINSNVTYQAIFEVIPNYYSSGDIVPIEPIIFYDRELNVNGVKLIAAGEIGGHEKI